MKLHSSLGPNPRLVRMFLIEKGIEVERVHYDIITGENRSDEFAKKNVLQTLPVLELDDGSLLTESTAICEYLEETHPTPNMIGTSPEERAEIRKWVRWFDQEIVVPMTMGFRATGGRPMFEPRMPVVSEAAGAELTEMANEKWRWLDQQLGDRNHICADRFTLACLITFCFANFGFTVGWKLPDGTDNLARFIDMHNQRESAKVWQDSE
ncbi:glutathione S-transferase family protein [Parerythrobacter jejuensis]|uniref:Glutathione S-transferase n=1 Tax=Parerythrobacter jejuensis TaxID=795812 RepID=A0A845ANX9_9SPHN|nr:glutathione S-transferase family protein [Parerythrobacter jejuensis]MXP30206.1 glutathione S-transferase [Parerythrobacter jejuensis]MXP32966.1 glutathione S-transferase [Parerythrobacter jejuensis]